ncbi:MAG TPA: zf-HC2 domain-containing protein, partial [Terriglobia bacterium]|nr:zf-HC2 domain-containing protein [Terriglobia bacterium]
MNRPRNCEEVRPVLLEYVLEEVPAPDRTAIGLHLEICADCSQEVGRIRQTLGVVSRAAAFEEVPQRIRIVAEPASRWAAFWLHPARLAFAGGALACLAIAALALARTTISYQDGNFTVAFGAAA